MKRLAFAALLTAALAGPARAQYGYPAGYGSYGWGGWGGGAQTVGGANAAGMGAFAAGAGAYNVQTAEARSMNANTAMQWNNYMYAINQRNSANEVARLNRRQQNVNETVDATYKRLHDNPNAHDIHTGDALNVVLDELVNPKVYTQVVQKAQTKVDSQLVMNIDFQHAANMILISLQDISARAVPDVLLTSPDFETDRQTIRAIAAKGRKEGEGTNQISPETLAEFRAAVKAAQAKVAQVIPQGTRQRSEADNYLKALYGVSKMLERPNVKGFLQGLKQYPQTTLGQLITFMHSFNLRFGAAKTPDQEAVYDQLYPMLVALRDQAQAGGPSPIAAAEAPLPNPGGATQFFSGMDYSHFGPQPAAHGPVPPPPAPR